MPLILEYSNSRADYLAQYELAAGDAYRLASSEYSRSTAFWGGMFLFAGFVAYQSDNIFLMCLLLVFAGYYLISPLYYSRRYWAGVERSLARHPEKTIKLEVRDGGLHETVEGIESFVPWASVKSFTLHRDTAFIDLTANLQAIVPRSSVKPAPAAFDDLLRALRDKGIKELPNKAMRRPGSA